MATAQVKIEGADKLERAFNKYPQIARPRLQDAIVAGAAEVQKHATRDNVPWRTGNLVQSFGNGITIGNLFARISPTAHYAVFVHEGTKHIKKPNPFMPRIAEKSQEDVNKHFERALELIAQDIADQV